jgi:hypothetical protein
MTPGKLHPWHHSPPEPSRAAREAHEEIERRGRIEQALEQLAEKVARVECLDELEKDEARDRALCDAVVRGAAGPRRLMSDEE